MKHPCSIAAGLAFVVCTSLQFTGCASTPVEQPTLTLAETAAPLFVSITPEPSAIASLAPPQILSPTTILQPGISPTNTPPPANTATRTTSAPAATSTRTNTPIPSVTRTPTVTPTRIIACTPPPCNSNEVFMCPGVCLNGCGTQCATKTPTPSPFPIPSVPANFSAVGSGSSIEFSLDDNSNIEQGYHIYQIGIENPVATFQTLGSHGTGHYTFTWNNVACNYSATFVMRAYSPGGVSEASNSSSAVTVPCPPSNFAVTGTTQMGSLYISFTDNASNETGFRIYRANPNTPITTLPAWPGIGVTSSTAIGPMPCGTNASYYARAYNSAGESVPSNTSVGTTFPCK
jgi:hypothetical protein